MKKINIGITINIKDEESIWINGITQNVINLYQILENSPNEYNVSVVNVGEIDNNKNIKYDIDDIVVKKFNEIKNELDIMFILGSLISDQQHNILKKNKTKLIYYNCGSSYMTDMEEVLFGDNNTINRVSRNKYDEIWCIPQNYKANKHYLESIHKVECKSVPFVWSSLFIDYLIKNSEPMKDAFYKPTSTPKRISSFEPNINIVKYAMYNIIIVEKVYNYKPELIKHFYVTNTQSIINNKFFIDIMGKFEVVKNKIATFETRYRIPYFLKEYTDIVIAHQMYNPLNYAYLDALYLKYPLVHNASMIKDAGYYYSEFDADKGMKQLIYAIEKHDDNLEEYEEKSKKVLNRYLPTNEESISIYDKMIKKLLNG